MRIALITPVFPHPYPGVYVGVERVAASLARGLSGRGHDVHVVTTFWNGGAANEQWEGLSVLRVGSRAGQGGRMATLFDGRFRRFGADVVAGAREVIRNSDVVHALATLPTVPEIRAMGVPVVSMFHHHERVRGVADLLVRPFHHRFERRAYRASDRVIALTSQAAGDLVREFGVPRDKVRIVPNGVDPTVFTPPTGSREPGPWRLLFVGAHEARKRIDVLLESVRILRERNLDVVVDLVGEGALRGPLKRRASALLLRGVATFHGHVKDDRELAAFYGQSDVFVFPSELEGFGIVLLEAMASGRPIVAARATAVPEVLDSAGILVPPGDPAAFADAIAGLLADPTERARLGRAGLDRVAARYTWRRVAEATEAILAEAVSASRA